MTPPVALSAFSPLTLRVRESGARVPDARLRDHAYVEQLRHLSRTVNGWRRPRVQHARRIARGRRES